MKGRKFNGERLRSARVYRSKTIDQLSKETNIDIENIKKFERNELKPGIENVLSLVNKLNFPKEYFYEDNNLEVDYKGSYFKSHPSTYRKEELSYIEKIIITHKIYNFIEMYISCPRLNIIHADIKHENIEDIAMNVRDLWGVNDGPLLNMVNLMEVNGFLISTVNAGKNSVGAFSQKQKIYDYSRYFIAVGNDKRSAAWRNYDLACQLGHVVLHDYNKDLDKLSKKEFENMKDQANDFACAFLLPKERFLEDLAYPSDLEFYVELKSKWIVPISTMILRAYQLGAISYRKYEYLVKEMSKLGWDKKEPLDNIKGMNPALSKKAIELLIENKIMTENEIVNNLSKAGLSLNIEDIEELLGLKKGTLALKKDSTKKNNNVTVVNFKR